MSLINNYQTISNNIKMKSILYFSVLKTCNLFFQFIQFLNNVFLFILILYELVMGEKKINLLTLLTLLFGRMRFKNQNTSKLNLESQIEIFP